MRDHKKTLETEGRTGGSLDRAAAATDERRKRISAYQTARSNALQLLSLSQQHSARGRVDDAMSSCQEAAALLLATFGESDSDYINAKGVLQQLECQDDSPTIVNSASDTVVLQDIEDTNDDIQLDYNISAVASSVDRVEQQLADDFRRQLELIDVTEVPEFECRQNSRLSLWQCRLRLKVCTHFGAGWWSSMRSSNPTVRVHARGLFAQSNAWAKGDKDRLLAEDFPEDLARLCIYEPAFFDSWCRRHGLSTDAEILEMIGVSLKSEAPSSLHVDAFVAFASRCGKSLMADNSSRVSEITAGLSQLMIPKLSTAITKSPNSDQQANLLWILSDFPWEPSRRDLFDRCMSNHDLAVTVLNCLSRIKSDPRNRSCDTLNDYYFGQLESAILSPATSTSVRTDVLTSVVRTRMSTNDTSLTEKIDVLLCRALRMPESAAIATDVLVACGDSHLILPIFLNTFCEDEKTRISAYKVLQGSDQAAAIRALWSGLASDRPEEQANALSCWLNNPNLNPVLYLSQIVASPSKSQQEKLGLYVSLLVKSFDDLVCQSFRAFGQAQFSSKTAAAFFDRYQDVDRDDITTSEPAKAVKEDTKIDNTTKEGFSMMEMVYELGDQNLIESFRRIVARADGLQEQVAKREQREKLEQENEKVLEKALERKSRNRNS